MLRHVGMVTSALWSDVDGDGWPDLLLTLEWGQVKYFHNDGGKKFEDWTEKAGFASAGTGWWRSIATADFNGDGRPDFVVGNVGLNTQYRADPEHPALLFSGDFAGRGSDEIVEAYYENGQLYPWRSRTDLGAAIPSVLRRYRWNNDYARATLPEILGADRLAAATRLAATELRSGVFLSQPDGRYRFEPLPRIAQIAPADGIVAGDFDGDGHADIYVVQNSYAPRRCDRPFRRRPEPAASRRWPRPFRAGAADRERAGGARRCQGARGARPRQRRLAGLPCFAERRSDARISKPGRRGPAFPSRCAAGEARQPAGGGRACHGGVRRRHDPNRGSLRRLGLLQPVDRGPVLRLHGSESAATRARPLAVRRDDDEPRFLTARFPRP